MGIIMDIFLVVMFHVISSIRLAGGFKAIWNVPTFLCEDKYGIHFNLSRYGIIMNTDDTFRGDAVTILYRDNLGLYPWINRDGSYMNGGLPQLGNLTADLKQVSYDILYWIPEADFGGVAVIDWEEWRPIFVRNGFNVHQKIYIEQSEALVQQRHPDWSYEEIKRQARIEFEGAARHFMQKTLEVCQKLRPHGRWGFYGFPSCYNYRPGQKQCTDEIMLENNRLHWLFNTSSALLPSIYLEKNFGTHEDRYWHVHGDLEESLRVQRLYAEPDTPILPYTRYRYRDTGEFYDKEDLNNTIQQAFVLGLDGVVIWDSSETLTTMDDCVELKSYVLNTLGPYVKQFTNHHSHLQISQNEHHKMNNELKKNGNEMMFAWFLNLFISLNDFVIKTFY